VNKFQLIAQMSQEFESLDFQVLLLIYGKTTESMTSIARRYNLTKQSVSKRVKKYSALLGERPKCCRSVEACKSYSARAKRVWRKRSMEMPTFSVKRLMRSIDPRITVLGESERGLIK
jgi:predicted DNA-binding protein YlxM (UPF0122 family)